LRALRFNLAEPTERAMTEQVQEAQPTKDANESTDAVEPRKPEAAIYSGPCDLRPDESE
jgi:hypothetical protein